MHLHSKARLLYPFHHDATLLWDLVIADVIVFTVQLLLGDTILGIKHTILICYVQCVRDRLTNDKVCFGVVFVHLC